MAKRRVGVEYSPSMLEPVRPGAVSPDRALCLPTFIHFVIVNKTSLSFSVENLEAAKILDTRKRARKLPGQWPRQDVNSCQKRPTVCQKRPSMCQKRPRMCQPMSSSWTTVNLQCTHTYTPTHLHTYTHTPCQAHGRQRRFSARHIWRKKEEQDAGQRERRERKDGRA
jgi:hypothetical protein